MLIYYYIYIYHKPQLRQLQYTLLSMRHQLCVICQILCRYIFQISMTCAATMPNVCLLMQKTAMKISPSPNDLPSGNQTWRAAKPISSMIFANKTSISQVFFQPLILRRYPDSSHVQTRLLISNLPRKTSWCKAPTNQDPDYGTLVPSSKVNTQNIANLRYAAQKIVGQQIIVDVPMYSKKLKDFCKHPRLGMKRDMCEPCLHPFQCHLRLVLPVITSINWICWRKIPAKIPPLSSGLSHWETQQTREKDLRRDDPSGRSPSNQKVEKTGPSLNISAINPILGLLAPTIQGWRSPFFKKRRLLHTAFTHTFSHAIDFPMYIICQKAISIGFPLVFQTLQWAKCVISQQTLRCQLLRGKRRNNSQFNDLPGSKNFYFYPQKQWISPHVPTWVFGGKKHGEIHYKWIENWNMRIQTYGHKLFSHSKATNLLGFPRKKHPSRHLLQLFIIIHIFGQITSATGTHMAVPCDIFVAKRRYSFLNQTDFCS